MSVLQNANSFIKSSGKITSNLSGLRNITIKIFLQIGIIIGFGYILYEQVSSDNIFKRWLVSLIILILVASVLANYSKGQWEDKIITLIMILIIYIIYYVSWWNFINFFEFSYENPLVITYFLILSFFSIIIIVSRFTYLNVIKTTGWAIGLSVLGLFIFTYSIYGSLIICEIKQTQRIQDPLYITLSIYFTWFLIIGILFFSELFKGQTKLILIGISIILIGIILNYTWNRCQLAKKEKDEPSWINNSAHLGTIMAYLNVFIGHFFSSGVLGFMSFSILDQCSPKNDPRRIAIGALLIIILPVLFFIQISSNYILTN